MLLAAITARVPSLHGRHGIQVAPLRGTRDRENRIRPDSNTRLHLRGASPSEVQALSNTWLDLRGAVLILEEGKKRDLSPSPHLVSRLVIIPDAVQEQDFLAGVLKAIPDVIGDAAKTVDLTIGRRRAIQIKNRHLLGYPLHVTGLTDEASLALQNRGLGWGTSMGCGVFYPGSSR